MATRPSNVWTTAVVDRDVHQDRPPPAFPPIRSREPGRLSEERSKSDPRNNTITVTETTEEQQSRWGKTHRGRRGETGGDGAAEGEEERWRNDAMHTKYREGNGCRWCLVARGNFTSLVKR